MRGTSQCTQGYPFKIYVQSKAKPGKKEYVSAFQLNTEPLHLLDDKIQLKF